MKQNMNCLIVKMQNQRKKVEYYYGDVFHYTFISVHATCNLYSTFRSINRVSIFVTDGYWMSFKINDYLLCEIAHTFW